jgi:tetratricopeptide (TPR) repeat protein
MQIVLVLLFVFAVSAVAICLVLLGWTVVVFLHEMGHALMSRALGAKSAEIFVGSYGEREKAWQVLLPGRITLWFRLRLRLALGGGLCRAHWRPEALPGAGRQAAFLLAGPVASSIVAAALLWPAFRLDVHGALKMALVVFGSMSVFDLVVNLLPFRQRMQLVSGGEVLSDGYQLYRLAARTWFNAKDDDALLMERANGLYNAGDHRGSADLLRDLLSRHATGSIYLLAFSAYYRSQQFVEALALVDRYPELAAEHSDVLSMRAYLFARTEQLGEALALYTQLIDERPADQHPQHRNNRGYTCLLMGRNEEALCEFAAVIVQEPGNAYAHAQRGRVRLALGDAAGLADLHYAQELNPNEPFALCNLGLHAHAEGRYAEALAYFEQAAALDANLHRLVEYMAATRACLPTAEALSVATPVA